MKNFARRLVKSRKARGRFSREAAELIVAKLLVECAIERFAANRFIR